MMTAEKRKRWIWGALRLAVAAGLLALLYFTEVIKPEKLRGISLAWVLAAVLVFGAAIMVTVERFRLLMTAQEIPLTFGESCQLTFIGVFFNICFPGATGGDVVKAYYATRRAPDRRTAAVTVVFFDRLIGASALTVFAFLVMLLDPGFILAHPWRQMCAGVMLFFLLVEVVLFTTFLSGGERWTGRVERLLNRLPFARILNGIYRAVRSYRHQLGVFFRSLFYSLAVHGLIVICLVCLAQSLPVPGAAGPAVADAAVPTAMPEAPDTAPPGPGAEAAGLWDRLGLAPERFFFLAIIGMFVNALPGPPSGIGLGEWGAWVLFGTVGRETLGATIFLLLHVCMVAWSLVGGAVYVFGRLATLPPAAAEGEAKAPAPEGASPPSPR